MDAIAEIARAFHNGFASDSNIRKPLLELKELLWNKQSRDLPERVLFDLESCIAADIFAAFNGSLICEHLFSSFREIFQKTKSIQRELMWARAIIEPGIIINLFNCRNLLTSPHIRNILDEAQQERVKKIFEAEFPRLIDARDAIAHEHDRSIGHFKDRKISDIGQMTRSTKHGIAELLDPNGQTFEFDFASSKIVRLTESISQAIK